jgi:cytochrome P450
LIGVVAEQLIDPYPGYRWLRDEAPVHYLEEDDLWFVSRYDHCLELEWFDGVAVTPSRRANSARVAVSPASGCVGTSWMRPRWTWG